MNFLKQYNSDEEAFEVPGRQSGLKRLELDLNPADIDPIVHSEVRFPTKQHWLLLTRVPFSLGTCLLH
jgi:hypothetical protein